MSQEEAQAAILKIENLIKQVKELNFTFLTRETFEDAVICSGGAIQALEAAARLIKSEFK